MVRGACLAVFLAGPATADCVTPQRAGEPFASVEAIMADVSRSAALAAFVGAATGAHDVAAVCAGVDASFTDDFADAGRVLTRAHGLYEQTCGAPLDPVDLAQPAGDLRADLAALPASERIARCRGLVARARGEVIMAEAAAWTAAAELTGAPPPATYEPEPETPAQQ